MSLCFNTASCDVVLPMPTFTEVAEMAGISRVMGGYHIQADNVAGLKLGGDVARHIWPKIESYIDGTAVLKHKMDFESAMSQK